MIVYLDMDEVLSDFILSACEAHNVDKELMDSNRKVGDWSILPALAKSLNIPETKFTNEDFWYPINKQGIEFWANMAETDFFSTIMVSLYKLNIDPFILSSPTNKIDCQIGKAIWLKERFHADYNRFIFTSYKNNLAKNGTILIDDNENNCLNFTKAGGKSILFPSLGNRLYKIAFSPWEYVESLLKELLR